MKSVTQRANTPSLLQDKVLRRPVEDHQGKRTLLKPEAMSALDLSGRRYCGTEMVADFQKSAGFIMWGPEI